MEKRAFSKGDFIKYTAYNGSEGSINFGVFEGVDLAPEYQYTKKYSLALYYDSHKYCNNLDNGVGWGYAPVLEIATNGKEVSKHTDSLVEDSWWSICTPLEKEKAIAILADNGYEWDEENLALVKADTHEIVHKIIVPKIEYNGDMIKPICKELKSKLANAVRNKNKSSYGATSYRGYPYYGYCGEGYNPDSDEYWD